MLTYQLTAILGVVFEDTLNPAKFGVVLTYTLATSSGMNELILQDQPDVERLSASSQ